MVLVSVISSKAGSMSPTLIIARGTTIILGAREAMRADAKVDREAMEACIVCVERGEGNNTTLGLWREEKDKEDRVGKTLSTILLQCGQVG